MKRSGECPCCGGTRCALTYCFRMQAACYPTRAGGFVWKTKSADATGWQNSNGGVILKVEHGIRGLAERPGVCHPKGVISVAQAQAQGQFDWEDDGHRDPTA